MKRGMVLTICFIGVTALEVCSEDILTQIVNLRNAKPVLLTHLQTSMRTAVCRDNQKELTDLMRMVNENDSIMSKIQLSKGVIDRLSRERINQNLSRMKLSVAGLTRQQCMQKASTDFQQAIETISNIMQQTHEDATTVIDNLKD